MSEEIKVDKNYIEAYNQGYEINQELGLKPDILKGLAASNNRMQAMYDGMLQAEKDRELEKDKDIIASFDMDSISSNHIDLTIEKENRDKGKELDI